MRSTGIQYDDNVHFGMLPEKDGKPSKRNYSITLNAPFKGQDVRLEHPREGISLFLNNYCFDKDAAIPYEIGSGALNISTVLSGSFRGNAGNGPTRCIDVNKPCDMAVLNDNCDGTMHIKGDEVMRSVGAYIAPELLLEMIEGDSQFADLDAILRKRDGSFLLGAFPSSPATQLIATQILNCALTGPCRRMFLEGKTLELISLTLGRLVKETRPAKTSLSRYDSERVREAYDILIADLIAPPTIKELARQAGINEFKLKRGFRQIFGSTIYQTLRSHRMDHARIMLEDAEITVGTAASMVGYTNMGHFIAAFRDQFGVTPGDLLKQSRQRRVF